VARVKPIVAVKSGRTTAGTRAASSHTAAMASSDGAVDALFRQTGVIRVDTLEQLLDTAQLLAHQPLPAGRRVAIVCNAGGPGILAADACVGAGLEVPELAAETQQRMQAFVNPDASVRNPIDLVAGAPADAFEQAIRVVLADPAVDAVLAIFVPPLVTRADDVAAAIAAASTDAGSKPVVACFLGRDGVPDALRGGSGGRPVPSYAFPESAAHALARAADLADWRRRAPGSVPDLDDLDVDAARALVTERLADAGPDGVWLDATDAAALCRCFGVPVVATHRVTSADDAARVAVEIGFPVALKAGASDIVHKTDVGAVALDLVDAEAVRSAYDGIAARLGAEMGGAIVQPMVPTGIETIVGVTHDRSFGPLVMFGMGGTTAELVRDRALRVLPLTDVDAAELVRSLRASPLLFGYRNSPAVDVAALETLLLRVGRMADELPELVEMDANPVIVSAAGAIAVDLKMRLAAPPLLPPAALRRMRT
ncbi:MAG TPA: acetate--CoA ligase family protein, partial [Acidimicrobiia bacterium]|nr:acetate--CoA ligase family protein [Acidimicrobiia bacterium]